MFQRAGFRTARLDIKDMEPQAHKQNPMDLTTDAGFATLAQSGLGSVASFPSCCLELMLGYFFHGCVLKSG